MKKLNKMDWELISEALDMLLLDWGGNHPNHERLEEICRYAVGKSNNGEDQLAAQANEQGPLL